MRRLVVCCDGTWNSPSQPAPTNVWRLHEAVAERGPDGVEQRRCYVEGVGTRRWERWLGGVTGYGLSGHVQEGYRFLVEAFEPGDELFLLGFSRGAYTARSLAGLVRKAGVLRRDHAGRVEEAYALYRSGDHPDRPEPTRFREAYAHTTRIRCIGVWDTVGALGVPVSGTGPLGWVNRRWQFHDTDLSSSVDAAFHAVSLDERRKPFVPTLWSGASARKGQRVEQVWFAGVHSDVGGGYAERGLADITLRWMAERAGEEGLALRPGALEPPTTGPDPHAPAHDSLTGVYRLLGPVVRRVGEVDPAHEAAASTAAGRQDRDPSYAPNLRAYRQRPDARVVEVRA